VTPFAVAVALVLRDAVVGVALAVALIGVAYRRLLDPPSRWLVVWSVVDAAASLAGSFARIVYQNNQYVAQCWYPLSAGLAIGVLASTVTGARTRRAVFVLAAVVALAIIALTVWVEKFGAFARFTGAIHGVTLLLVGSTLVLQRARRARGDMFSDPTFFVGAAFVMMGVPSSFLAIGVRFLGQEQRELHRFLYALKNVLAIGSYGMMVMSFHLAARRGRLRTARAQP
jgi:hypothetical protein